MVNGCLFGDTYNYIVAIISFRFVFKAGITTQQQRKATYYKFIENMPILNKRPSPLLLQSSCTRVFSLDYKNEELSMRSS